MSKNKNLNTILTLCFVIIVDAIGISLIYPVLAPLFSVQTGGILSANASLPTRDLLYGITMAVFPLFMFIGAPIMGDLSDHFGRKRILLTCLFGEAISMLITGISVTISNVSLLLVARASAGLMAANFPVAQAAIIDISTEENKIINISLIGLSNTLGFVLGPIISGFLSDHTIAKWMGFSTPFYATALLACINAIILIFTFRESFIFKTKKINIFTGFSMFISAFKTKELRNLSIVYSMYLIAWSFYIGFITLFLVQKYHYSSRQAGYFISWIALILSVALLLIIRLVVKFLTPKQIVCNSLAMMILGIILAINQSLVMQWVSSIFIATGAGLIFPSMITLFSNAVNKNKQGWIMGTIGALFAFAGGFSGLMIAVIVPISYNLAYCSMLILWCMALGIFLLTEKQSR